MLKKLERFAEPLPIPRVRASEDAVERIRADKRRQRVLRLQGTSHRWLAQSSKAIFLLGSPRRAGRPARATDLSDWLSSLVLPSAPRPTTSDTRFRFFTPAPTLRLPPERRPPPARRCPVPVGVPSASTP